MGGKKKAKDHEPETGQDCGKVKGRGTGDKTQFVMPEADRICFVAAPVVLPPQDEELENHMYVEVAPRKLQLGLISLVKHPVFIGAISNFLMEDECRRWIQWGENVGFEEAKQKQTSAMAFRDNGRIEFESEEVANLLWLRLRPFVPEEIPGEGPAFRCALGCSPRIRVYRYAPGQRFGQHVDGSRDEPSLGGRTHFTVLVYLNGGEKDPERRVRGGETCFWKDKDGNPTTMVLAFPPTLGVCLFHGHGNECMIHEGAPVQSGAKYVLRTDVVYS